LPLALPFCIACKTSHRIFRLLQFPSAHKRKKIFEKKIKENKNKNSDKTN
jgi:hypothetical protein